MRIRPFVSVAVVSLTIPAFTAAATEPLPSGFVPFKSIAGISVGTPEKTVAARLGAASSTNQGSGHGITQLTYSRTSTRQSLLVSFDPKRKGDPVTLIQASGSGFRTAKGIGLGSTSAAIRHAIPGLRCQSVSCQATHGHVAMSIALRMRRQR